MSDSIESSTGRASVPCSVLWVACLAGFVGVALGAFGAHALRADLGPDGQQTWRTGTTYLLVHSVFAVCVGRAGLGAASLLASVGGLLFAGSLYALALGAPGAIGMVTPIGGCCMLVAWGLAAWQLRAS